MTDRDQRVRQLIALAGLGRPDAILTMPWVLDEHEHSRPAGRREGRRRPRRRRG